MPRVPQITRQTAGPVDVSLGDTTDVKLGVARQQAAGLESLGRGLGTLAAGISQYEEKRDALTKQTAKDQASIAAAEAAQMSEHAALTDADRAPDGSDLVGRAEQNYNESKQEWMEGLDEDAKKDADLIWRNAFLRRREGLLTKSRQEHVSFVARETDKVKDGINSLIANDSSADALSAGNNMITNTYNSQHENGMINEAQRDQLTEEAIKANSITAVNTLMREHKYDEAEERVLTGDMSTIFGTRTDAKGNTIDEKSQVVDMIQRRRIIQVNARLNDMKIEESKRKQQMEDQRSLAFNTLMEEVVTGEKPEADIRQQSLQLLSAGAIEKSDHNFVESVIGRSQGFDDDNLVFQYTTRMMDGEDLKLLQAEVKSAVNTRQLSADEGTRLLKGMKLTAEKKSSSGKKMVDLQLKNAKGRLDAVFGSKEAFDRLPGASTEKKIRRNLADRRLLELMFENPQSSTVDLADRVVEEFGGVDNVLYIDRIPGIKDQDSTAELDEALVNFSKQFKSGKLSPQKFNQLILDIKKRKNAIQGKEDILNTRKFRGK